MSNTPDIRVLVGVEGEGRLDGKSGQLILKSLNSIANEISKTNAPKITLDLNVENTTKNLNKQLSSVIKNIKVALINIDFNAISSSNTSPIGTFVKDEYKKLIDDTKGKTNLIAHIEEKQGLAEVVVQKAKDTEATKKQEKSDRNRTIAIKETIKQLKLLESETRKTTINNISNNVNKIGATDLLGDLNKLKSLSDEIGTSYSMFNPTDDINKLAINIVDKKDTDEFELFLGQLKQYITLTKELETKTKAQSGTFAINSREADNAKKLEAFLSKLQKFKSNNDKFQNNSVLSSEFGRLESLTEGLRVSGRYSEVDLDGLNKQFYELTKNIERAGLSGQSAFGKLRSQMEKLGVYFSASAIMMGSWRQIKAMTSNVIELDKKVTDLQIATGNTRQETEKLIQTYSKMGKELGATTIDVANAADAWLRQGYSINETNTLIKNSMMLSKLGQIDSAEATKALTSAMKGYKLSVEDSIGVVDKFTSLDMEAAVSAGYIATAMAETSTGARLAGIEMDRLAGYITKVGEVTQDGAESVGVFFKTLFARMGNIKEGKLVDPETQEDLSSVEVTLDNLGIKLRENGGEFRNFGTILDEVYSKWDKLGSVNQRALAVAFSGVRNQEKFLTLMDNYAQAMEYAETAANSAGTSLNKYETSYLKSVEASQERFTAQFETLSKTIINSELISGTYDTGTGVLWLLNSIVDVLGTIPTLATVAIGAMAGFTNTGWLKIVERQIFKNKYAQPLLEFVFIQAIVDHVLKYEESAIGIDYPIAG